jgi:catechol 2,3-dioxygenase-like lactoylglutathione lyase family enzyme
VLTCRGDGRALHVSAGEANRLHYALYGFAEESCWQAFLSRGESALSLELPDLAGIPPGSRSCVDPDGNRMVFAPPGMSAMAGQTPAITALPPAGNQHFALRTTRIDEMLAFYCGQLGFHLSDRVLDGDGRLRACFLRTDSLHHSLALFGAPVTCFDHQSFESPAWSDLKDWADHMSRERIEIVWGVGRHGPGNDVFFMIRDPDGNLAEISSEIEVCDEARPAGVWPHEERTLNLWGKAIMRS